MGSGLLLVNATTKIIIDTTNTPIMEAAIAISFLFPVGFALTLFADSLFVEYTLVF